MFLVLKDAGQEVPDALRELSYGGFSGGGGGSGGGG